MSKINCHAEITLCLKIEPEQPLDYKSDALPFELTGQTDKVKNRKNQLMLYLGLNYKIPYVLRIILTNLNFLLGNLILFIFRIVVSVLLHRLFSVVNSALE